MKVRTCTIYSGREVVRIYDNVIDYGEEYNEELGNFILWINRGKGRENILILCSGWNYSLD